MPPRQRQQPVLPLESSDAARWPLPRASDNVRRLQRSPMAGLHSLTGAAQPAPRPRNLPAPVCCACARGGGGAADSGQAGGRAATPEAPGSRVRRCRGKRRRGCARCWPPQREGRQRSSKVVRSWAPGSPPAASMLPLGLDSPACCCCARAQPSPAAAWAKATNRSPDEATRCQRRRALIYSSAAAAPKPGHRGPTVPVSMAAAVGKALRFRHC
mmetsp:Transcript_26323/g.75919  ORF Transcript_26323/g.75919 Transcript_26323/m.75919 type:complete len:214 (+) Transcript_26323:1262-1903(+)